MNDDTLAIEEAVRHFLGLGDDVRVDVDEDMPEGMGLIAGDFTALNFG